MKNKELVLISRGFSSCFCWERLCTHFCPAFSPHWVLCPYAYTAYPVGYCYMGVVDTICQCTLMASLLNFNWGPWWASGRVLVRAPWCVFHALFALQWMQWTMSCCCRRWGRGGGCWEREREGLTSLVARNRAAHSQLECFSLFSLPALSGWPFCYSLSIVLLMDFTMRVVINILLSSAKKTKKKKFQRKTFAGLRELALN